MDNQHSNYEWKNIYIFISSTFNDMHAERDYLIKNVFPELSVWCNQRMLKLVDIDLRWGITEEDSKINKRVVDICLNRIDDCRPFFLCFLGQRRGWIPKREDVSEETVNRQGIEEVLGKDSVTEMEIRHAVLQPFWDHKTEEMGLPVDNAFFFFRDNKYLDNIKDRPELIKIFTNAIEINEKAADEAIIKSKTEIIEMCERHNHAKPVIYEATWDNSLSTPELKLSSADDKLNEERCRGRLSNFNASGVELKNTVIQLLKEAILKEYPEREHIGSVLPEGLELEILEQSEFINTNFEGFIKRKDDFEKLNKYISSNDKNLLAVTAEAGLGKTTLIANWILELLGQGEYNIVYRFVGASNRTDTINHILESIIEELKTKDLINLDDPIYSEGEDILANSEKIKLYFYDILSTLSEKTIIVIDGLNQLSDELEASSYLWMPNKLPHGVKFIVSFKSGQAEGLKFIEFLEGERKAALLKIEPFTDITERKKLVEEYLSKNLKSMDDEKLDSLLSIEATKNPLFLKIVLSELRVYGSFETLLDKIINDFGSSPKDAFISVLKRLEEDPAYCKLNPKLAVSSIFGLISASRNGLEISELTDAIMKITNNQFHRSDIEDSIHLYLRQLRTFLARRENRVDFLYEAFALAAKEKYSEKEEFFHEVLSTVFRDRADINGNKQWEGTEKRAFQELPYHLSFIDSHNDYRELLLDYTWLYSKLKLFKDDVRQVINDFKYNYDSEELKLLCRCLEQSENILKQDCNQLPVQLWGRLSEIDNKYLVKLLNQSVKETKYVWLRPERAVLGDVRNGIIGSYEGKVRHMHKLYSYKNRIIAVGYFYVDIWDTDLNKIIYSIDIEHYGSEKNEIRMSTIESSLIGNKLTVKTSYNIYVWNVDNGENILSIGLSEEECEELDKKDEDEYIKYKIKKFYSYNDVIVVIYNDYLRIIDINNSKTDIVFSFNNTENEHSLINNYFITKNNSEVFIWDLDNFKNIKTVDAALDEKIESYDLYEDNFYVIKSIKENINNKKVFKKAFLEIWNIRESTKNIVQLDSIIDDYDSFFNKTDYSENTTYAGEDSIEDYITLFNVQAVKNNIIIYNGDICIIDSSSFKFNCSLHGEFKFAYENKIYYYNYENKIFAYDLETQKIGSSYEYRPKSCDTFYCVEDCLFTYHDFDNDKPWMNIWNMKNNKWIGTIFGGHCQTFVKDDKIIAVNETELYIIEKESGILLNSYDILFIDSLIIAEDRIYCGQDEGSISIVDIEFKKEIISSTKDYISNLRYINKQNSLIYCADDEFIRIYDNTLKNEIKSFGYVGNIEKLSLTYPYFIALTSDRKFGNHNEYVPKSKLDDDYFIKKLEDESLFNINMWNVETNKSFEHSMELEFFPSLFTYENYLIIKAKSSILIYNIYTDKCVFQYEYKNSHQYIKCCGENVLIGDGEILYIYDIIKNKITLHVDLFDAFKNVDKESGKYDTFTEYEKYQINDFTLSFNTWKSVAEQERFYLTNSAQDSVYIHNHYLIIKLNDQLKIFDTKDLSALIYQKIISAKPYESNRLFLKGRYLIEISNGEVSIWNLDTLKLVDNFEIYRNEYDFSWKIEEFKDLLILKVGRETKIWNKNIEQYVHIFCEYDLIKQQDENLFLQDLENFNIYKYNMEEDKLSCFSSLKVMDKLIDVQEISDFLVLLEYKRSKVIYNVNTQKIESVNISFNDIEEYSITWGYKKVQSLKIGEHFYFNGSGYHKCKIEGGRHGTK